MLSTGQQFTDALDGLDAIDGNVVFRDNSGDPSPSLEWDLQVQRSFGGTADLNLDFDIGGGAMGRSTWGPTCCSTSRSGSIHRASTS